MPKKDEKIKKDNKRKIIDKTKKVGKIKKKKNSAVESRREIYKIDKFRLKSTDNKMIIN
jgi:hypothetical protein